MESSAGQRTPPWLIILSALPPELSVVLDNLLGPVVDQDTLADGEGAVVPDQEEIEDCICHPVASGERGKGLLCMVEEKGFVLVFLLLPARHPATFNNLGLER